MAEYTQGTRGHELQELLSTFDDRDGDHALIIEAELFQTACDEDTRHERMIAEVEDALPQATPALKYAMGGRS